MNDKVVKKNCDASLDASINVIKTTKRLVNQNTRNQK
jgi:hypothetical protein